MAMTDKEPQRQEMDWIAAEAEALLPAFLERNPETGKYKLPEGYGWAELPPNSRRKIPLGLRPGDQVIFYLGNLGVILERNKEGGANFRFPGISLPESLKLQDTVSHQYIGRKEVGPEGLQIGYKDEDNNEYNAQVHITVKDSNFSFIEGRIVEGVEGKFVENESSSFARIYLPKIIKAGNMSAQLSYLGPLGVVLGFSPLDYDDDKGFIFIKNFDLDYKLFFAAPLETGVRPAAVMKGFDKTETEEEQAEAAAVEGLVPAPAVPELELPAVGGDGETGGEPPETPAEIAAPAPVAAAAETDDLPEWLRPLESKAQPAPVATEKEAGGLTEEEAAEVWESQFADCNKESVASLRSYIANQEEWIANHRLQNVKSYEDRRAIMPASEYIVRLKQILAAKEAEAAAAEELVLVPAVPELELPAVGGDGETGGEPPEPETPPAPEAPLPAEIEKSWQEAALEMAEDQFAVFGFRQTGNEIVAAAAFEFQAKIASGAMSSEMFKAMMREVNGIAKSYETQLGPPPEQKLTWPQTVAEMGRDKIAETAFNATESRIAAAAAYRFRQGIATSQDEGAGFKAMMRKINAAVGKYREKTGKQKT